MLAFNLAYRYCIDRFNKACVGKITNNGKYFKCKRCGRKRPLIK